MNRYGAVKRDETPSKYVPPKQVAARNANSKENETKTTAAKPQGNMNVSPTTTSSSVVSDKKKHINELYCEAIERRLRVDPSKVGT